MKRWIVLLSLGWGIFWVVFVLQFIQECYGVTHTSNDQIITETAVTKISFPYRIRDTNMLVEGIGIYEGPYLEDGTNDPVADVAALQLKNLSDSPLERGAVILEIGGELYIFEAFAIPPGQSAFVIESKKKAFTSEPITFCSGWAVEETWLDISQFATIEEYGIDTLMITNISDDILPTLRVLYKSFDQKSGMYIGGICYEIELHQLEPGQSISVKPYHYVSGYSKVVAIKHTQ